MKKMSATISRRRIPGERRARTCAQLTCPPGADRLTRTVYQT
jgi:hypothetical protein